MSPTPHRHFRKESLADALSGNESAQLYDDCLFQTDFRCRHQHLAVSWVSGLWESGTLAKVCGQSWPPSVHHQLHHQLHQWSPVLGANDQNTALPPSPFVYKAITSAPCANSVFTQAIVLGFGKIRYHWFSSDAKRLRRARGRPGIFEAYLDILCWCPNRNGLGGWRLETPNL